MENNIEVLNTIKPVKMIPIVNSMTSLQVAEYYEVKTDTIRKLSQRKSELLYRNQMLYMTYKEFRNWVSDERIEFPRCGAKLYPVNAIIIIGFLLKNSIIAKQVREKFLERAGEFGLSETVLVLDNEERCMFAIQKIVKELGLNLELQKTVDVNGKKYYLDGYIPELNLAIEYDEAHHDRYKEKDMNRELDIKSLLNCDFIRVDDRENMYKNIGITMKKIFNILLKNKME